MPDEEERKVNAPQRSEREIHDLEAAFQRAATVGDLRPVDLKATLALMVALQSLHEGESKRWRIAPLSGHMLAAGEHSSIGLDEEPAGSGEAFGGEPRLESRQPELLRKAKATRARQKAIEGTDHDPIVRARRIAARLRQTSL